MKDQRYRILLCGGQVRPWPPRPPSWWKKTLGGPTTCRQWPPPPWGALSMTSLLSLELKIPRTWFPCASRGRAPGGIVAVGMADGVKGYVEHQRLSCRPERTASWTWAARWAATACSPSSATWACGTPYTGQVRLQSGEIGDDFAWYLPSANSSPAWSASGVMVQPDYSVAAAAALVIQPMPGCPEDVLDQLEGASGQLANLSAQLAARHGDLEGLLRELLGPFEPEIIPAGEPAFRCNCSRERMTRGLIALGAQELTDLIEQDGKALLQCHFCNAQYAFDRDELLAILQQAKNV